MSATTIARLNDQARQFPGLAARLITTHGIGALPEATRAEIMYEVAHFDAFTPDNDPYREHDFGSFRIAGVKVFWKIDYYAKNSWTHGSENPADPRVTTRALTVMLADEY